MKQLHPKTVRRILLERLYEQYLQNPLEMAGPEDFLGDGVLERKELVSNMHYLYDRQLVELMMGYAPPMFVAARITPNGIDLVENRFEFNLRFPPAAGTSAEASGSLFDLIDRLVEEADFSPLDGEDRKCLLRDVQYLRDELTRPVHRWRLEVIRHMLDWIGAAQTDAEEHMPSLRPLRGRIEMERAREEG